MAAYDRNEWCTPKKYIDAVRNTFGDSIDLDPASSVFANATVQARKIFTKDESCLTRSWAIACAKNCVLPVDVFMNPPYGRGLIELFVSKFISEYKAGNINRGIVLTNNSTETGWAQLLLYHAAAINMPNSRIQFYHAEPEAAGKKDNRQAQLFFFFVHPSMVGTGRDLRIRKFFEQFAQFGYCSEIKGR